MSPKAAPSWALLAALSLLAAGCVGSAAAATAMETRGAADAAAHAWDPGAQLTQVIGLEGTFPLTFLFAQDEAESDYERAQADESIGDGRAEVWGYRYVAQGKAKAYVVLVDRDGEILREGEETRASEHATPLGGWSVDSDQALEAALAANEDLRNGVAGESFGIVSLLRRDANAANPVWFVAGGGGSLDLASGGFVEIDAVTGEVLKSHGGHGSLGDWSGSRG